MQCEYCNKSFVNKGNLNYHLKTAKFCLKLRENSNISNLLEIEDTSKKNKNDLICAYCDLSFTRKSGLDSHLVSCKEKDTYSYKQKIEQVTQQNMILTERLNEYKDEIREYKDEIRELKNQIKELAEKAIDKNTNIYQTTHTNTNEILDNRTVNTNNSHNKMIDNRVLNMLPLNLTRDNFIQTLEEKFSESHLMKGQKGVAEFMLENVLVVGNKDNKKFLMKCTDPSRKTFITLDKEGNIQKDINAEHLTKIISEPVKEKCQQIYKNIQDNYFAVYETIGNELEEGDEDSVRLSSENAKLDHATNKVVEISRLKNDNTEFVKNLIPTLTS